MKNKKVFSGQGEGEKIIKVLFRHSFVLIKNEFLPVILFTLSMIVMTSFFHLYAPYFFLIAFLIFIFSITWGFYSYFTYVRDKFIITDQRIIDIEQITFFTRTQREAPIEKIQDVTFEIKGVWGSIFNFGDVVIQTASESSLTLNDIPKPEKAQKIIFDLMREKESNNKDDRGIIRKMLDLLKGMGAREEDIQKELEKRVDNDESVEIKDINNENIE